jgi:hypothetical protein
MVYIIEIDGHSLNEYTMMTPGINFPIIAVMNKMPEVSKQNNP